MCVIMLNVSEKLSKYLTYGFLSKGIDIHIGKSPDTVKELMEEKEGEVYLLLDINRMNSLWLNFIVRLRYYERPAFKLIVLSSKTDLDFMQMLLLLNVERLISKRNRDEVIFKHIVKTLEKNSLKKLRQRYHRVLPKETDELTVYILNGTTPVRGKVISLSFGGVALQCERLLNNSEFKKGDIIRSQVFINRRIGIINIKIMFIKNNILGAVFFQTNGSFYNLLCGYLVERLSESEKLLDNII